MHDQNGAQLATGIASENLLSLHVLYMIRVNRLDWNWLLELDWTRDLKAFPTFPLREGTLVMRAAVSKIVQSLPQLIDTN